MFDNIASKIKSAAKVVFWVGIAFSLITVLIFMTEDSYSQLFILSIFLGLFSSWVLALLIYGFGHLIENSDKMVFSNEKKESKVDTLNKLKEKGLINEDEYNSKINQI